MGMASEQHAGSKVFVIGPGTTPVSEHIMRDTQVGARNADGGNDTIQLGRSFEEECNIGDLCKFINIFIEAGPRSNTNAENIGWLEWAFCCHKQDDLPPANTNLGTQTLGTTCTNYLRNECIYTGVIPIGFSQPATQTITLKIPKFKQRLKVGDHWVLYVHCRTVSSTETSTSKFKVMTSFMYRNYH